MWLSRYGYEAAANRTLDSILAYMRHSPTWAYSGGARSLGDLGNNGCVPRGGARTARAGERPRWRVCPSPPPRARPRSLIFVNRGGERVLMHYRAGLNAIPVHEQYLK